MIESLIMGYRYMMYSAQVSMGDDYDPEEEETLLKSGRGASGQKGRGRSAGLRSRSGRAAGHSAVHCAAHLIVGGVNHFGHAGPLGKVVLEAGAQGGHLPGPIWWASPK
mgnify:CR=1 FL=1